MRTKQVGDDLCVWLSERDTYNWCHRSGDEWPVSGFSGRRVFVRQDAVGDLVDFRLDGKDPEAAGIDIDWEGLRFMLSDLLPWRGGSALPKTGRRRNV